MRNRILINITDMNKPKFKVGDKVRFKFLNGGRVVGTIAIVDKHGTFERPGVVSYDIMDLKVSCLYKHIPEEDVERYKE